MTEIPTPVAPPAPPRASDPAAAAPAAAPAQDVQAQAQDAQAPPVAAPAAAPAQDVQAQAQDEQAPPAATPAPKKRRRRGPNKPKVAKAEEKAGTLRVVLTGRYPGFHALFPTIKFIPDIPVEVPDEPWVRAQLAAKYLREV